MELIYLYIRKYKDIFENEEFNFSSNFIATMKDNKLKIEENNDSVKNYYGDNVNNVVMFLGKNGAGKTTLLDILGMNRDDRRSDTYNRLLEREKLETSYFILYHLNGEYFGLEFIDNTFLYGENKILNIDMQNKNVDGALYKLPMGNIFKFENEKFIYCGHIMQQWLKAQNIEKKLEYVYITTEYNNRISNRNNLCDEDYTFNRRYYLEECNYEYLYKYFIKLNMQQRNNMVTIENAIKVPEHMLDPDKSRGDFLYSKKRKLDKLLGLKRDIEMEGKEIIDNKKREKDMRSNKAIFLETFCAQAIEYYFLEQFVRWIEYSGKKIDANVISNGLKEKKELEENEKRIVLDGRFKITDFQTEYFYLLFIIENSKSRDGKIDLKTILEYTLKRVEIAANSLITISDRQAVIEIVKLLEKLPETYFIDKRKIRIECESEKEDNKIIELFKRYDYYYKIRNSEQGSNCIFDIMKIKFPQMAEGEQILLNIISRTMSAIYTLKSDDSLVLLIDEPDRALHPELARNFLAKLLDNINTCKDRRIQIILSSHSPFIVTDILPESVYSIDMVDNRRKIINNKDTYATNIYYLLMDSFMLKNTFGEYSYQQLKCIIKDLSKKDNITEEKLKWIEKIINRVGEKTVKRKLEELYQKKVNNRCNDDLINMLKHEKNEQKLLAIRNILEKND